MSPLHAWALVGAWCLGWYLLWRLPRLGEARGRSDLGTQPSIDEVSVIVPARNEEGSIAGLLAGVIGADHRVTEVVVVDDGSTDQTAPLALAAGARVVRPGPPPRGSTGKAWACAAGAAATTGPVVVFVDADVTFTDGGLSAVIDELARRGGLVSVEPFHRVKRVYEHVSAFFGVITVMGTGAASPGRRRLKAAFGPVLACRRADYDAVGGHIADLGAVAEDVALAVRFERSDLPVSIFGGGDLISFRMYPAGPAQLVEGWTKNIATGAGSTPLLRLAAVAAWVTAVLSSAIGLVAGVLAVLGGTPRAFVVAVCVAAAFALQLAVMFRQLGTFGVGTALAYPLLAGAFLGLFVCSMYLTLVRREVRWKGRAIALHVSHPDP